jgi:copper resistance protein C
MRTYFRRLRLPFAALLSLGILFLMVGMASAHTAQRTIPAHASVLKAIPAIGSTVAQAPTTVTVFTAENINPDPKKSNLFVYGPSGEATAKLISQGNATVSLTNPEEMSVKIKPDPQHPDGVYVVRWITVSALDGDPDEGAFSFTVNSGTAAATPTPAATSTTHQTTPTTSNTSGSGGTPIWVASIIALVALLVGFGGGFGLGRRRSVPTSMEAMPKAGQQEQKEPTKRP